MYCLEKIPVFLLILFSTPFAGSKQVQPITIDPTVKTFDSIPPVQTDLTFFVGTVQDTSLRRDESGIVGQTRIRRKKMAPIICSPPPAIVVKRSVEGLLIHHGVKASDPDSADFTIRMLVLDFDLTESYQKMAQTMEATIAIQVSLVGSDDSTRVRQYIVKSRNSKSTIDTSKYAESIFRGAVESALREIIKSITR